MPKVAFAWYDLWVGAFYDQKKHILYVCPLPCLLLTWQGRTSGKWPSPTEPSQ